MPQLKTLTLHLASPVAPPFPFDVERTITLPFLTRLDISASPGDCALALAHLNVSAVTSLCLSVIYSLPDSGDVQKLLPYVMQHINGAQDTRPLQSMLIRSDRNYRDIGPCKISHHLGILAWPVPDIDIEVHDPHAMLGITLPPRVALAFMCKHWFSPDSHREILDCQWVMAGLPLNDLVMLAVQDIDGISSFARDLSMEQFWLLHSPQWPLLQRVRLAPPVERSDAA